MRILIIDKLDNLYKQIKDFFPEIIVESAFEIPDNFTYYDVIFFFTEVAYIPYHEEKIIFFLDADIYSGDTDNYYIHKNIEEITSIIRLLNKYKEYKTENIALKAYYDHEIHNKIRELSSGKIRNKKLIFDNQLDCFNFTYLKEQLPIEIGRYNKFRGPFSLLMIDLDNFRDLNELHGKRHGDEALKEITAIIKSSIRNIDLLFRFGGDEFCVFLYNSIYFDSMIVGERIRKAVEKKKFIIDSASNKVLTVSIGIFTLSDEEKWDFILSTDKIIHCVDKAVSNAKNKGKNTVIHFSDMVINGEVEPPKDF